MNKITDYLAVGVVAAVFAALILGTLSAYADRPDVIFSYSTGKCVRVDLPDGRRGDCSQLPEKYNHYWGE